MTNHRMFFVKSGLALTLAFSTMALETRAQAPNAENPAPQNTAKSWLDLGRTHARAGEWDQAHQAYNRVLGMDNLNARTEFDALAGIARAWRAEKKLPQMESALEEVLAGDFYHPVLMTSLLKEFATL